MINKNSSIARKNRSIARKTKCFNKVLFALSAHPFTS
jgi:hypothetical protein